MKRKTLFAFLLTTASCLCVSANSSFPVVNIQGKPYYYYEVKKGDSLYGIAKNNGWDADKLCELNPIVSLDLKKGARLYYPVSDKDAVASRLAEIQEPQTREKRKIRHTIAKGETIYSIAKKYNVPTDLIYYQNPSSRTGIKAGETLTIIPDEKMASAELYVIQSKDTPYSVAKKFNCAVEDIFRENPGVSEKNFKAGSTIRIMANANVHRIKTETVEAEKLDSFGTYKAKSNESWEGIARRLGVDVDDLKEINPEVELKKNTIIAVPKYEKIEVERQYVAEDPREKTAEGRMEIYEDVKASLTRTPGKVKVAIVLDTPSSKKDLEFSRGFITAVDRYKNAGFETDLEIIRGDRDKDAVLADIKDFKPSLIITTADKDYPAYLNEYAKENYAMVVNPFDLKSEGFLTNPAAIQLMPPSTQFNESVARYILDNFEDRKMVIVSSNIEDDLIANLVADQTDSSRILHLTLEELRDYPFYETEKYIVYATPTKKSDVTSLIDIILTAKEESPLTEIAVIGRPSWVTIADGLKEKLFQADVYIPSRFYFDMENADSKNFLADYKRIFRHPPLKSYPVYAASGYDVANYFLPLQAYAPEDYSMTPQTATPQLQVDVDLSRMPSGGYLNPICYMIRFAPFQYIEKIRIE